MHPLIGLCKLNACFIASKVAFQFVWPSEKEYCFPNEYAGVYHHEAPAVCGKAPGDWYRRQRAVGNYW
jgi:hypothetical protein